MDHRSEEENNNNNNNPQPNVNDNNTKLLPYSLPALQQRWFVVFLCFLQIIFLPLPFSCSYIALPFQTPMAGVQNNWVFFLGSLFNLGTIIWVYSFWTQLYVGKHYYFPIGFSIVVTVSVYMGISSHNFPQKGLGLIGMVVMSVLYYVTLSIQDMIFTKRTIEYRTKAAQCRMVRMMYANVLGACWLYVVLFFLFKRVQILLSIVYSIAMFSLKFILVLYTQKTTPPEYHGLTSFWTEFFHGMFVCIAFPSVNTWYVILFICLVQLGSMLMTYITLTDVWYILVRRVMKSSNRNRKIHPIQSKSFLLANNISASSENLLSKEEIEAIEKGGKYQNNKDNSNSSEDNNNTNNNNNYDKSESEVKAEFKLNMMKVSILSVFAQTLVPVYYIPLAYFLRYGWTNNYFPYSKLSEGSFTFSVIYAAASFVVALITLVLLHHHLKRKFHISYSTQIFFPLLVLHKSFFIFAIISGLSGSVTTILYHNQLYYAFSSST